MKKLKLSVLAHTWFIDIDGTIFKHNPEVREKDRVLPAFLKFQKKIPRRDKIILVTGRKLTQRAKTMKALRGARIRFDQVIFGLPTGERILINDTKPSGLKTAYALAIARDQFPAIKLEVQR